jgi:membrane protease YdiL (CAAX protease family)
MTFGVAVALTVAVLVVAQVLNNRLARGAYLATSLAGTVALLAILGLSDASRTDAGLEPRTGFRWALALVGLTALGYLGAALLPATRRVFVDRRALDTGRGTVAYQVLLRIPLGTALFEEVAFRGVLYGLVTDAYGAAWGTTVSSALFGLWHVPPSRDLPRLNPAAARLRHLVVPAAVLGTGLAGVVLCEVRRRSGGLLAPIALHWAVNAFAYLTALVVTRGAGRLS